MLPAATVSAPVPSNAEEMVSAPFVVNVPVHAGIAFSSVPVPVRVVLAGRLRIAVTAFNAFTLKVKVSCATAKESMAKEAAVVAKTPASPERESAGKVVASPASVKVAFAVP